MPRLEHKVFSLLTISLGKRLEFSFQDLKKFNRDTIRKASKCSFILGRSTLTDWLFAGSQDDTAILLGFVACSCIS